MKINPQIKDVFQECGITLKEGIPYLLCLYYGYIPSYIPELLVKKIHRTGIVKAEGGMIRWIIPLFEDQITGFEWVKSDFMSKFAERNKDRKGTRALAESRMKKFFVTYPDIRKDEVIAATELYLKNQRDSNYIMKSHNFIFKGAGLEKSSELKEWVDKYREFVAPKDERISKSNTMK